MELNDGEEHELEQLALSQEDRDRLRNLLRDLEDLARHDEGAEARYALGRWIQRFRNALDDVRDVVEVLARRTASFPGCDFPTQRMPQDARQNTDLMVWANQFTVVCLDIAEDLTSRGMTLERRWAQPTAGGGPGPGGSRAAALPREPRQRSRSRTSRGPRRTGRSSPSSASRGGGGSAGSMAGDPHGDDSSFVQRLQPEEARRLREQGVRKDCVDALGRLLGTLAELQEGTVEVGDLQQHEVTWCVAALEETLQSAQRVTSLLEEIVQSRLGAPLSMPTGEGRGDVNQLCHETVTLVARNFLDVAMNRLADTWLDPETLPASMQTTREGDVVGRVRDRSRSRDHAGTGGSGVVASADAAAGLERGAPSLTTDTVTEDVDLEALFQLPVQLPDRLPAPRMGVKLCGVAGVASSRMVATLIGVGACTLCGTACTVGRWVVHTVTCASSSVTWRGGRSTCCTTWSTACSTACWTTCTAICTATCTAGTSRVGECSSRWGVPVALCPGFLPCPLVVANDGGGNGGLAVDFLANSWDEPSWTSSLASLCCPAVRFTGRSTCRGF